MLSIIQMPKNINSDLWVTSIFLKTTCGLEGNLFIQSEITLLLFFQCLLSQVIKSSYRAQRCLGPDENIG